MCCLIYKVLCRCLIGRNFIISHCLHFVKHFFKGFTHLDSLIIIPHPEALVNIFFQDFFKPLSRFGIFCILSHPSLSVKCFFSLLTFRSLRDSSSILPYISPVVNCFFHNFQLFFCFFGFFCLIHSFSTTFHTHSTDLSTVLPHIDTLTPIWYI